MNWFLLPHGRVPFNFRKIKIRVQHLEICTGSFVVSLDYFGRTDSVVNQLKNQIMSFWQNSKSDHPIFLVLISDNLGVYDLRPWRRYHITVRSTTHTYTHKSDELKIVYISKYINGGVSSISCQSYVPRECDGKISMSPKKNFHTKSLVDVVLVDVHPRSITNLSRSELLSTQYSVSTVSDLDL